MASPILMGEGLDDGADVPVKMHQDSLNISHFF